MKALILAAGLGTRLAPITDEHPKCMTKVIDGKTIIQKQIENLLENNIKEITVITGYKSDLLINYINSFCDGVNFVESTDYSKTNNMYSAFLGKAAMADSNFIMMNADVFFDSSVLKTLLEVNAGDAIVTDIGNWLEESMKVVAKAGKLIKISKNIDVNEALGSSIDVYKFSKEAGKIFFAKCDEYINKREEVKLWSEVAINDILEECCFVACPLNGRWYEIDTHDDLEKAIKTFKE